jgi:hypothetical protein
MSKLPVGESIGFAYRFAFGQLGTIIGLIWIPMVVIAVLQFLPYGLGDAALVPEDNPTAYGAAQLRSIVFLFIAMLMYASIFVAVTQQALGLRQGNALYHFALGRTEFRMWGALLLLAAIALALLSGVALVATAGFYVAAKSGAGALAGLVESALLFGGTCAFIFVITRLGYLLVPSTVAEKKLGLERSWKLTHGNFWRITLVLFVVTFPVALVVGGAQFTLMSRELAPLLRPTHAMTIEVLMNRLDVVMGRHMPEIIGINLIAAPFQCGLLLAAAAFGYRALGTGSPPGVPSGEMAPPPGA